MMNKGLEALEKIKELYKSYVDKIGLNEKDILGFDLSIAYIEKELKAFKIVKRNPFAFAALTIFLKDFDTYEKWVEINPNCFTKEEYGLLKEVLNNG